MDANGKSFITLSGFISLLLTVVPSAGSSANSLPLGVERERATELMALIDGGSYLAAGEILRKELANHPQNLALRFQQARLFNRTGKRKSAVRTLQRLIEEAPHIPEFYNNLAAIYASMGELEKSSSKLKPRSCRSWKPLLCRVQE